MKITLEIKSKIEYYYIITKIILNNKNIIDISIFENDEWTELLNMSKKFEKEAYYLSNSSDYNYKSVEPLKLDAIYFLYYCDFCYRSGFSTLCYYIDDKNVYYELLDTKITEQI
jgi:hypothetical protein